MKKTWVKRQDIYKKPFYKQKFKMLLLFVFLLGIIFIIYNFMSINQLSYTSTPAEKSSRGTEREDQSEAAVKYDGLQNEEQLTIMRGIRFFDYDSYKPNYEGKFKCLDGSKAIPFNYLNDDYCDCSDGSDEPSTNACNQGKFFCKYQKRHLTGRGKYFFISSSRVNDGICDCCDGSDEWIKISCKKTC